MATLKKEDEVQEEIQTEVQESKEQSEIREKEEDMESGNNKVTYEEESPEEISEQVSKTIDKMSEDLASKIQAMKEQGGINKSLSKASSEERKEHYSDQHIIPLDERPSFETPGEKNRRHYLELYEAWRAGQILTGRISMVEEHKGMVVAAIFYHNFKIMIPLPFLAELRREVKGTKKEQEETARRLANERLGSEISYIIKSIDEGNLIAAGDRLAAMKSERQAYYLKKRYSRYLINEGDIVEARICYVEKGSVCVEVRGVEKVLREVDCLWTRTRDLREHFRSGDRVPVKITKLERTSSIENGRNKVAMNIAVSIKEATPNPKAHWFNKISEGATMCGEVTQTTEHGVFVKLKDMDYDILCPPNKDFPTPPVGTNVLVGIWRKNEDTYSMSGFIKRQLY